MVNLAIIEERMRRDWKRTVEAEKDHCSTAERRHGQGLRSINFHVSLRHHGDYHSVFFGWKITSGRQNSNAEVRKYSHLINMLLDRQIVISNDNLFNKSDGLWTRSD